MTLTRPLGWFVTVVILGVLMTLFSRTAASGGLRDVTQSAANPVEDVVHAALAPIADFVSSVGSYSDVRRDNAQLQAENQRLTVQVAQLQEQAAQSGQISDLDQVQRSQPDQHFTEASVIALDPSNLHDQIEIDRGANDGLRSGMSVLGTGGALVGTVRTTMPSKAWVALVTDSQSNVNAMIAESRALAVVRGSVDRKLSMEFVAEGIDVKVGDTVMTSGLGGAYPAGYLIGHVSSVQGRPVDLFKNVTVEPTARLDSLEHVLVLTSFTPAGPGG